ncbi:transposase [Streptococcus pluranimalium]
MDIKRLTVKHAQDILELASNTIGTTSPAREFELVQIIENIQHYEKLIKQANHKIDELMAEINSVIVSVPGISNRLGSVILAEIRNINAFNNPAQLQAFAGLEPSIYQSGQIDTKGKMVKRGSTHLRWALLQAAIKVARYSPAFKAYFRTKLDQGKHYYLCNIFIHKTKTAALLRLGPQRDEVIYYVILVYHIWGFLQVIRVFSCFILCFHSAK